jgi:TolB protein
MANSTLDGTEFRGTGGFYEDSHPDWSPDGNRLIFDSSRNGDGITRIYTINPDGDAEQDLRLAGQQPSWAPDNNRFVMRACDFTGNRCGLWIADAAGNRLQPALEYDRAAHPDWSPLDEQIVYQSPENGSWDLFVINADGSDKRQLTDGEGIEGLPAWSPDGQWIAYLSNQGGGWQIEIIRADGTNQQLVFPFDGGIFRPSAVEPYGVRDWIDEQISWSK